jgi:catechol 2,3-dioxygenase-like lactoylglutathione lyase family enzyme
VERFFILILTAKHYRAIILITLYNRRLIMRLDGFGLFVNDMSAMIRFYRDVLGFEIKEDENTSNVYLIKDGTLFLLYGRRDFEKMTSRKYEYVKGLNGHSELALYVDTFEEVDTEFRKAVEKGAVPVLEPTTEPWGQRTCYIADPEGNLIEIGSFNKPFER